MSYDLTFWKYKNNVKPDAQGVYKRLMNAETVDGLDDLPVDAVLDKIAVAFKDWQREGDTAWVNNDRSSSFEVSHSTQYFRVDCRHMQKGDMNKLIDIGIAFNCPVYDPQINERF